MLKTFKIRHGDLLPLAEVKKQINYPSKDLCPNFIFISETTLKNINNKRFAMTCLLTQWDFHEAKKDFLAIYQEIFDGDEDSAWYFDNLYK